MDPSILISRLYKNIALFNSMLSSVESNQYSWKPKENKWSILEVTHHLYDEEKEDFRLRLKYTLELPQREWLPIDPEKWVNERNYNQQNFKEIFEKFIFEREKSIKWLTSLKSPNWNNKYQHPILGKIAAGDLLASWIAHDFLHMRQITKLHLEFYKNYANPFKTKYAMP